MVEQRSPNGDVSSDDVIRELQEGIRRRRAWLAAETGDAGSELLPDLERSRHLDEPPATSAYPLIGPFIGFVRKLSRRILLAWYVRPILRQQNRFNDAASARIRELVGELRELRRELDELKQKPEAGGPDDEA